MRTVLKSVATVLALGPVVGQVLTLVAMRQAFLVAVEAGEASPVFLAASFSRALVATLIGLLAFFPAVGLFWYLNRTERDRKRRRGSWILLFVMDLFYLPAFPVGTVLGAIVLYLLFAVDDFRFWGKSVQPSRATDAAITSDGGDDG